MTVNVTCTHCDGRHLCDACRSAARSLAAAGCRVEHSTRYEALRAAASSTYGFDACIVPIDDHERSVADAAAALLRGKRIAFVVGGANIDRLGLPADATVLSRERYAAGDFPVAWLSVAAPAAGARADIETATIDARETLAAAEDRTAATRRLKRVADVTRAEVARAALPAAPRLDMLAVLDDEIAWARASGICFSILLVHLPGLSDDERIHAAGIAISTAVRSADVVAGNGDDFLVVLAEAKTTGAGDVARRVIAAIANSRLRPKGKARRARGFAAWSVGQASYPDDGAAREALLGRATATLTPIEGRE